jgi:hypothetical protein
MKISLSGVAAVVLVPPSCGCEWGTVRIRSFSGDLSACLPLITGQLKLARV